MNEEAKQFLEQYKNAYERVKEIEEVRTNLYSKLEVGSIKLGSDGSSKGTRYGDERTHIHAMLVDLDKDLEKEKHRCYEIMVTIELKILKLSSTESRILRYRYIYLLEWVEVCDKIGYSWTQTHKHHSQALMHLTAILKSE